MGASSGTIKCIIKEEPLVTVRLNEDILSSESGADFSFG